MEELKNETVVTDVEETEVIEVNETLGRKNRKTFKIFRDKIKQIRKKGKAGARLLYTFKITRN